MVIVVVVYMWYCIFIIQLLHVLCMAVAVVCDGDSMK